jgi:hypothetical protein
MPAFVLQVVGLVAEKVRKFPSSPAAHLMSGLISEGLGSTQFDGHASGYHWADALASYTIAADLAGYDDWQPRWRLGLLQYRYGRYDESNRTLSDLMRVFTGE